jgi:GT2 family glycosyltransferase
MKIAAAIVTTGRPLTVAETLQRLSRQTRPLDHMLVVGAAESDLPCSADREAHFPQVAFNLSGRGSSKQRNRALDLLGRDYDVVIFFDDDFVAARDFVAGVERLLSEHADVVAASGHLLADGFRSAGIAEHESEEAREPSIADRPGAYGCNMIVRIGALPTARFDENLPLYGWLEDLDFSAQFARVGRVVETNLCVGVHLGVKNGRSPGLQVGYSHVANPLYLARKGSISWRRAVTMVGKVLIANSLRSFAPEPFIDRRGRLVGNLRALADLATGRLHPLRVLDLKPRRRTQQSAGQALS